MKKLIFVLFIILFISCEKEDKSVELLTNGMWIGIDKNIPTLKEIVIFNKDGTYTIEEITLIPISTIPVDYSIGRISGKWKISDDEIHFLTSKLELPNVTNINNIINSGLPIGYFYGFLNDTTIDSESINYWTPDSTDGKVNTYDSTQFIHDQITKFENQDSELLIWKIQKLTNDSLIVNYNLLTIRYIKKNR